MRTAIRAILSIGVLITILVQFGVFNSASAEAAEHVKIPVCDFAPWYIYAMPDDKTYAILLESKTAEKHDVHLELYSDASEYAAALPAVDFERIDSPSSAAPRMQFSSPVYYVTLPQADALLRVVAVNGGADPASAQPCRPEHADTDYYRRLTAGKYYTVNQADRDRQDKLIDIYIQGVTLVPALITVARVSTAGKPCPVRYRSAFTTAPVAPRYPTLAREQSATGVAFVRVDLDVDGSVAGTSIFRSSGNQMLDASAMDAARGSAYNAEIFRCEPISGSYIFRAEFSMQ